jgi:hypothetical protein
LLRRIRLLGQQWERSQQFAGINCVTATNQLAGGEPATFDRPIDSRFGDPCGRCRTAWCVHRLTSELRLFSCSHALVKERLRYAAEQRREVRLTHRGAAEATHHPGEARLAKTFRIQPDSFAIYRDRRTSLAASAQSVEPSRVGHVVICLEALGQSIVGAPAHPFRFRRQLPSSGSRSSINRALIFAFPACPRS